MTEPALDRLRNQIADGFRDARVPSTVDEIADDSEVPEVHDLVGKHWSVVPLETIVRVRWDPGWFHRLGIRHYLPAFMLAAIREPEIAETVIAYLERGGVGGERDALWPDEKRAVRAWLRYMRDEHQNEDAAKALAIYWENPAITPLDEERTALFRRARAAFAAERTAHEATELAAAVTGALEHEGGGFLRHVSVAIPYDAAQRAPIAAALSIEQLAFIADFLDYARRRWPDVNDEATVQFWRAQLFARGG
jgi:hypothetical protein